MNIFELKTLLEANGVAVEISTTDRARIAEGMAVFEAAKANDLKAGEWGAYLSKFDSEKRLAAFLKIQRKMGDAQYWKHLAEVWQQTDFAAPNRRKWERLFFYTRDRAAAGFMMKPYERRRLAELPTKLRIYRGQQAAEHALGFSWTLSRRRAEWFARTDRSGRMGAIGVRGWTPGPGVVIRGLVRKTDVLCYLAGRKEREVLVHPRNIQLD
jgi:hypothetical protein